MPPQNIELQSKAKVVAKSNGDNDVPEPTKATIGKMRTSEFLYELIFNLRRFHFQLFPLMADLAGLLWLVIIFNFSTQTIANLTNSQSRFYSFSLRVSSAI